MIKALDKRKNMLKAIMILGVSWLFMTGLDEFLSERLDFDPMTKMVIAVVLALLGVWKL